MMGFLIGISLLCTALTFSQSKMVYHTCWSLLEYQPAILGTGEVLTICSKMKKIKELTLPNFKTCYKATMIKIVQY